ncbi:uncharacterized protein LOC135843016 [Planococcus citri]|uniref:uncharacterized protein LOC135843016 n=1 Tax=Planococcus citri TaxID=170843 RepID=UPI0031F7289E
MNCLENNENSLSLFSLLFSASIFHLLRVFSNMVKMICFNNGIVHVFTCLFLLYLNPNSIVLCDEVKELNSTPNICEVPILSPHTNNTYTCIKNIKNESKSSCVSNGTVFESTVIKITCDPGYSVNGEDALVSVCYNNEWVPPIKGCIKKCEKLNPVNVHLECFRKNISIPCDEKFLLPGVTVRPTCKYLNTLGVQSYPGHPEIQCLEDGNWDSDLHSCVPGYPPVDCGQLPKNPPDSQTLGMPWDVAILRPDKGNICFGTIISSRVILTSEFCMLASVSAIHEYESLSRNPLDPAIFVVAIVNDIDYHKNRTWWSSLKYYASELNLFRKYNHFTALMIKEFRYFKHGNQDKSLFHDALIVIMEKEINFNSQVYPACVQWENPKKLNITTGIAKVQQFNAAKEGFSYKDYSFMSHDTCQENPSYPYLVFVWANLMYGIDEVNGDRNDTKLYRKSNNQTAFHEGKWFCLELKENELNDPMTVSGSGVMIEKDHRYFIRGIVGEALFRNQSNNDALFKSFMNEIRNMANMSSEDFSKSISDAIINGSFDHNYVEQLVFLFKYNFTSLLRNHLKRVEAELTNQPEKLVVVTDIADYVDWIKHVVAEVDPYFNTST